VSSEGKQIKTFKRSCSCRRIVDKCTCQWHCDYEGEKDKTFKS